MTSQVAVYNMNGIAIASDTVVTSSSEAGSKTTANAEKIYELGPGHKVLVMHHGGTTLNDVHHQFQLAEWALTLREPLPKLSDYIEAYITWSSMHTYHSEHSDSNEIRGILENHYTELKSRMEAFFNSWQREQGVSDEDAVEQIEAANLEIAKEGLSYLKKLDLYEGMTEMKARDALKKVDFDINSLIESSFEGFLLNTKIKSVIKTSTPYLLARVQDMPWDSNLAFTGFGANDPFPGAQVVSCRSIYAGQLIQVTHGKKISNLGL